MFRFLFYGVLPVLLFYSSSLSASFFPVSGPVPGVSTMQTSLWTLFGNPAGLCKINTISAGTFYHSLFSVDELSDAGFAVSVPMQKGVISGLGYRRWGYSLYKQQVVVIGLSKSFGDRFCAGVTIDWSSLSIANNYGNSFTVLAKAGFILSLSEQVQLGFSIFNPGRSKITKSSIVRYPVVINSGLGIKFGNHASLNLGIEKSIDLKPVYSSGVEYVISDKFILLAGFSNGADAFYFGYTFRIHKCSIGMHSGYHNLLGFSPSINITFKK